MVTPRAGKKMAKEYNVCNGPYLSYEFAPNESSIIARPMLMRKENKEKNQYSFLLALPLNTAYFFNTPM